MSQPGLYRSKPYQNIASLGVSDGHDSHQQLGSSSFRPICHNSNLDNDAAFRPDAYHLVTAVDRKTSFDIDNARKQQFLDGRGRSTTRENFQQLCDVESSGTNSGRRSAIPVLGI